MCWKLKCLRNKRYLAKLRKPISLFGLSYSIFLIYGMFNTVFNVICEPICGKPSWFKCTVLPIVILLQSLTNMFMFVLMARRNRFENFLRSQTDGFCLEKYKVKSKNFSLNSKADPTFVMVYCRRCEIMVAKTCHHCPLCNCCVFKKDHHCYFLAKCVGHGNQRYFIVYLFWALIGSSYSLYLSSIFVARSVSNQFDFRTSELAKVKEAFVAYFSQSEKMLTTCSLMYIIIVTLAAGSCLYFLIKQFLAVKNVTSMMGFFECKDIFPVYKMPKFNERMRIVFGPYWLFNFIVPLPLTNEMEKSYKKRILQNYARIMHDEALMPEKKKTK